MSDKKTEFGQYVAQGDHDPSDHAKNVEEEARFHGVGHSMEVDLSPGANQGGPTGPTPPLK